MESWSCGDRPWS
uniref:Uncharacterized protein n=1 Tax=Arundo donax TaxID=35708 RepID=A0A0A9ELK0_ARUDO